MKADGLESALNGSAKALGLQGRGLHWPRVGREHAESRSWCVEEAVLATGHQQPRTSSCSTRRSRRLLTLRPAAAWQARICHRWLAAGFDIDHSREWCLLPERPMDEPLSDHPPHSRHIATTRGARTSRGSSCARSRQIADSISSIRPIHRGNLLASDAPSLIALKL